MIDGLIIRTEQTIPSLAYIHKDGVFNEERCQDLESRVLEICNKEFHQHGIHIKAHESEYLHFTIRTLNFDGECKTNELKTMYRYFTGVCEALDLKVK